MTERHDRQRKLYRETVGREPVERVPPDHPYRWQWDYTGRRDEREGLLDRLAGIEPEADDGPPQEESLFDTSPSPVRRPGKQAEARGH